MVLLVVRLHGCMNKQLVEQISLEEAAEKAISECKPLAPLQQSCCSAYIVCSLQDLRELV